MKTNSLFTVPKREQKRAERPRVRVLGEVYPLRHDEAGRYFIKIGETRHYVTGAQSGDVRLVGYVTAGARRLEVRIA